MRHAGGERACGGRISNVVAGAGPAVTICGSGRIERLRGLQLQVAVRDHLGRDVVGAPAALGVGAGLIDDGRAWVLLDGVDHDPARGLGPALAWALRRGATSLDVIAPRATGILARRAEAYAMPTAVWHLDDRTLLPAVAEPLPAPPDPSPAHLALMPMIEAGGARPVVEHGIVIGEVRGLEVCRVVDDAATGIVRLDVGVGAHDREAFALMHGDLPTIDALRRVVGAVEQHRRPDGRAHPLHRLVPERLVRWQLEQEPARIGLVSLDSSEPPVPRATVKERAPCTAAGRRADGTPVVVVCSVGVDLDLLPYVTDARLAAGRRARAPEALVVLPARDLVPVTTELAGLLRQPVVLVPLDA